MATTSVLVSRMIRRLRKATAEVEQRKQQDADAALEAVQRKILSKLDSAEVAAGHASTRKGSG
eukprot:5233039-Prymnesium_polylepis.2